VKHVYLTVKRLGIELYRNHIGDYMRRWILQTPFGALRVHKILRSDRADAWHDHPADLTTLVLGHYREWMPAAFGSECYAVCTRRNNERTSPDPGYGPRDFPPDSPGRPLGEIYRDVGFFRVNRIPANKLHRIELCRGPVWTIGWMRPRTADATWGFVNRAGHWVEHNLWRAAHPERDGETS
jgi:hypothetical protein